MLLGKKTEQNPQREIEADAKLEAYRRRTKRSNLSQLSERLRQRDIAHPTRGDPKVGSRTVEHLVPITSRKAG